MKLNPKITTNHWGWTPWGIFQWFRWGWSWWSTWGVEINGSSPPRYERRCKLGFITWTWGEQ